MLKYKLDSLDGLEEGLKALYKKDGDKFVLDVDDSGAKTALQKERERAEAAEKALKEREAAEAKAKADAEKAQLEAQGKYEKLTAIVEAEKKALLEEKEKATQGLKSYLLKSEITAAIAQHKGNPHLQKLVEDQFEAVLSPDGQHKVVVKGDPSKTPAQFIESLKADASYGAFFEGSGVSGSGAPRAGNPASGTGKTMPRSKFDSLHPTEQASFIRGGGRPID